MRPMHLLLPVHLVSAGFHRAQWPVADRLDLVEILMVPEGATNPASASAGQDVLLFPKSLAAQSYQQAPPEVAATWLKPLAPLAWSLSIAAQPTSANGH